MENQIEHVGHGQPIVSLEAFFAADTGSIGCNPDEHPELAFFKEHLQNIESRADVCDVAVEITHIDICDVGDIFMFPLSEYIFIVTSASKDEVSQWVKPLMPTDIKVGETYGQRYDKQRIPEGYKVFALHWE